MKTITIYDDDVRCPKCGREREGWKGLFHHPDGGDEEAGVICAFCGEPYIIVRTVIAAEYSVKEGNIKDRRRIQRG